MMRWSVSSLVRPLCFYLFKLAERMFCRFPPQTARKARGAADHWLTLSSYNRGAHPSIFWLIPYRRHFLPGQASGT